MLYSAPRVVTSAVALQVVKCSHDETIENPRGVSGFVCVLHRVNGGKKSIQRPTQLHRGG